MRKIIAIFLPHQGCPHRCAFCHQPHITGVSATATLTPDDVRRQIECALAEPKSRSKGATFEAAFYGGAFTGLPLPTQAQLLQTVQPYVARGDLCGIRLSTHPAMLNDDILALLAAHSVTTVELGAQSFDENVLRLARRGHSAEGVIQAARRLQNIGIAVGVHLMIGLPGDSREISVQSARQAIALRPAFARLHPTLVIRGTLLEQWHQQGQYAPLSLDEAVTTCKMMLVMFQQRGIPVIRIGLQPTESLHQHIVAGAHHPAMRQLVESALFMDVMAAWRAAHPSARLTFAVAPADLSTARGQRSANLRQLSARFARAAIRIMAESAVPRGEIRCVAEGEFTPPIVSQVPLIAGNAAVLPE